MDDTPSNSNVNTRVVTLEIQYKNLESEVDAIKKTFDLYVRLERYRVVETAVFGLISLITTCVLGVIILSIMNE